MSLITIRDLMAFIFWGVFCGIGIPLGATLLFSPLMQAWTPIAVLLLLGLIVLWVMGIMWMLFIGVGIYAE